MNRILFVSLLCCLTFTGCKKFFLNTVADEFVKYLWEDRPESISCTPTTSSLTIDNSELTFSEDHMPCISINMSSTGFDRMRNESRFGPHIHDNNGATATAVCFEYLGQCDVPFPSEYNWYSGSFQVDGVVLNNIGIRKKGFLGSVFSIAPAMKVQADRYVSGQTIGITHNITLNNNAEDKTRIMQCLNYKVFELAGYPAPRCNLANVSVNNEALGVYSHIEVIDEAFLDRVFGNHNGHLYEGQLVDFVCNWLPRWEAKTTFTNDVGIPLLEVANVLKNASDEDLYAELDQVINVDEFVKFWALEVLLDHSDGYCVNRNNFYVYFNPNDNDRAVFIPWGLNYFRHEDLTKLEEYVNSELPRRLSRVSVISAQFVNTLNQLLTDVWDETMLTTIVDNFAAQVQTGQVDPEYNTHINEVKAWILNRRIVLETLLLNGLPIGNAEQAAECYNG